MNSGLHRIFFLIFLLTGFGLLAEPLHVAIAGNLAPMEEDLKALLASNGIDAVFSVGSSGVLSNQIIGGAPFDLFLSADMVRPEKLFKMGWGIEKPKAYARGLLIEFSRKKISLLRGENLKNLSNWAIPSPDLAPYGKAALEVLSSLERNPLEEKTVLWTNNVSQAAQFALTSANGAFLPFSILNSLAYKSYKDSSYWTLVPENLYESIFQGILLLTDDSVSRLAYNLILGDAGRQLFEEWGYGGVYESDP